MRMHVTCTAVSCTALGLMLTLAAPAAQAQTVQTVRTVTTTTRTARPIVRHRVVVTRRTYVTSRAVPATSTTTTTTTVLPAPAIAAAYPAPLYDYIPPAPAPVVAAPYYSAPLYDTVVQTPPPVVSTTVPAVAAAAAPGPVGTAVPFYRYVYQPDRILVIDPNTGVAVQAIPR
jgi:hypothetical protein